MRVIFDPASRIHVGVGYGVISGGQDLEDEWEVSYGIGYRSLVYLKGGESDLSWQLDHRIMTGWFGGSGSISGSPALVTTAYRGTYLHHLIDGHLVFPGTPPMRLYFPFDVGADVEVGRLQILHDFGQPASASPNALRLGVLRASLLLDPWRSARPGNSLELGVGLSYDLDIGQTRQSEDYRVIHHVAPMTLGSVRFRTQDASGLTVLELDADAEYAWSSEDRWDWRFSAQADLQRTILSINDQPLVATARLSAEYGPLPLETEPMLQISAVLGIQATICLR
ncbi:MAG: hypothetical protein JW797_20350 [Bradymonadales bacterium]|nr:hypothetical protein [Bradymonadales bacterium]